ncbi:CHASE2 domain-containing sensor protein [Bacillus ectoiniformans]|uniref:YlaH-like family protein n=1 Tax=Bacillus ectoiniformans TaxID=1494429 RepID=UPI00195AF1BD|nr:YlaH-like family protein [Bacillus ectoiniformans]MBM7647268.1 CHASE2 domain-containing sensor protein [Bacillus ectoiniformans]
MAGLEHVSPLLGALIEGIGVTWAVRVYWAALILLSILVYNLGFAKKLTLGKNIIVYISLIIGSLLLLILSYQLPVMESLLVAVLILGIYKIRLKMHKEEEQH